MMMDEQRRIWLSGLKLGNEVYVQSSGTLGTFYDITVVEKVTNKGQFQIKGNLYNSNGERREGWSHYSIIPVTDEIKQGIKDRNKRYRVGKTDFSKLSQDKINRIYYVIMEENHE